MQDKKRTPRHAWGVYFTPRNALFGICWGCDMREWLVVF